MKQSNLEVGVPLSQLGPKLKECSVLVSVVTLSPQQKTRVEQLVKELETILKNLPSNPNQ